MILFGCQSSLCVVVELGEELPSPADIQLAHSRLRALCLGGRDETRMHSTYRRWSQMRHSHSPLSLGLADYIVVMVSHVGYEV